MHDAILNVEKYHFGQMPLGLPARRASRYMWQMLSGLAFVHHHGFVHRDIKNANYLLFDATELSPPELADFGLAIRLRRGDKWSGRVGTPHYMAPELWNRGYDKAVDVWSLGVSAASMCIGRPPFDGKGDDYLMNARAGHVIDDPMWANHDARMKSLVREALTVDPKQRPTVNKLAVDHAWLRRCDAGRTTSCCTLT